MTIRGFRLSTGEVILTQVQYSENQEEYFVLKDPAEMIVQEIEPGRAGVGLQPFIPYGKDIRLYKTSITASFDLDQQIENEYNRLFGSGIVIASANAIKR